MTPYVWSARVWATAPGLAEARVRQHRFTVGEAVEFDEASPRIAALEYLLGALGADLVNGLRALARARRVPIERIEALVHGELNNPLTYLGVVGETGHPGVERLRVTLYVAAPDPDAVRALYPPLLERSPLFRTLGRAASIDVELDVTM